MADKPKTQQEKLVDYIELTGSIMEKSSALLATKEAQDKECDKLIPNVVQALVENERIEPHEKEAAVKVLKDPVKVLEILAKTAAHKNDAERAKIGQAEGHTKKAGYNSLNDGYVGRKSRPDESESNKAFRKGLGL